MPQLPAEATQQTVFSDVPLGYRSEAVNPDAGGASVGGATSTASNTLSDIAIRRQEIYNENTVNTAIASLANRAGDIVKNYRAMQGQNAVNGIDDTTKALNDTLTDERAKLNPAAQRMFDFVGQRVLRSNIDSVNSHWDQQFKQSTVDAANAAMDAADNQGALHYNNPREVSNYMALKDQQIDALAPKLGWTPDEVAAQHTKAQSAYLWNVVQASLADKDYKTAQSIANQYHDQIDPKVQMEINRGIRTAQEAGYIDQEHAYVQQEHARVENDRALLNSWLPKIQAGTLSASDILRTSASPEKKIEAMNLIKAQDAQTNKPIKSDPVVFQNLLSDVLQGKMTDETPITQAAINGKVDFQDMTRLQAEFERSKSPEGSTLNAARTQFNQAYKQSIDKSTMLTADPEGGPNWYSFNKAVDQKITDYRSQGKNPIDLFDPNNKDFVGKLAPLYQRTPQQIIQGQAQQMRAQQSGQAPPAAVQYLLDHPEMKDQFKKKYGYVPEGIK